MSSLYKRKKSPYYMWSTVYKGRKIARSTKMTSKTYAKKVQTEWDLRLIKGNTEFLGIDFRSQMELNRYALHYLNFISTRKSENMVTNSKTVINRFLDYTKKNKILFLDEINVPAIDSFLDYLDISPKSKKNYHAILRVFFKQAVKEGLIKTNPTLDATLPKIEHVVRHRPLEPIDLEIIFRNAGKWNSYYQFLHHTGLRAGDVALLKIGNIDRKRKSIVSLVRKSDKFFEFPLADSLIELIPISSDKETPVFPDLYSDNVKTMNYKLTAPRKHMQTILRLHGRDKATLHSFRVTFNNSLRDLGLSIDDRRILLAHASSETTKIYTHPNFDLASKYVNMMPTYDKKD